MCGLTKPKIITSGLIRPIALELQRRKNMILERHVVDSHVHIVPYNEEKLAKMLAEMREVGVCDLTVQSLASHFKYDETQNLAAFVLKRDCKDIALRVFASLHECDTYADIPYEKQAEALLEMGADGFKFIQMKPDVRKHIGKGICHESYDKVLSLFEERGTPVTLHTADPDTFWDINRVHPNAVKRGWFYGDGSFLSYREHYDEVFRMLDKHPRLNIILAHFFFLDENYEEAVRVMEKYPRVRFDLTPHPRMFKSFSANVDLWREFFIKYQDRIIFGTDADNERESNARIYQTVYYSLTHSQKEFPMPAYYKKDTMRTLDLPREVVDKIVYKNFIGLVGEEPAPLKTELLNAAAERMLRDISEKEDKEQAVAWLKKHFDLRSPWFADNLNL